MPESATVIFWKHRKKEEKINHVLPFKFCLSTAFHKDDDVSKATLFKKQRNCQGLIWDHFCTIKQMLISLFRGLSDTRQRFILAEIKVAMT